MNTKTLVLTLGAALSLGGAAFAQQMPMPPVSSTDRQYIIKDAQGSVSDYANGAAAVNQAQSPAVRQLGVWFMEDHNRLNMELLALAQSKGITVPLIISDEDKTSLNNLAAKSGADFDRAWLTQAIKTNKEDIKDGEKEVKSTTDPEVKRVATDFLTTEYAHLAATQSIMDSMK